MEIFDFRTPSGILYSWCQYAERVARILRHDRPSLDTGLRSLVSGVRVTSLTPATGSSPAGRHGSGISPRTALILPCAGACERLVRQVKSKKFVSEKDLVLICQKGLSSYLYLVSPATILPIHVLCYDYSTRRGRSARTAQQKRNMERKTKRKLSYLRLSCGQ